MKLVVQQVQDRRDVVRRQRERLSRARREKRDQERLEAEVICQSGWLIEPL